MTVKFQNFSNVVATKFFWDFGDGTTSLEKNPIHVYTNTGKFDVKLRIITDLGAQGVVAKTGYIEVSNAYPDLFFYATPSVGYSYQTAQKLNIDPTTFTLIDQSEGDVVERFWIFEDGGNQSQLNPNIHYAEHVYQKPGTYSPVLLLTIEGNTVNRIVISNPIKVL